MKLLNRELTSYKDRPVKVLQYGEGNFLRAFADYMFDICNEKGSFDGNIVMIKPTSHGNVDKYTAQDSQYTVSLRGIADGKAGVQNRLVTCVKETLASYEDYDRYMAYAHEDSLRFIVSNTTEAGIVFDDRDSLEMCPPCSFPGKLTKFLYERFTFFKGDSEKGLILLPVELIDDNGKVLKECVIKYIDLWGLSEEFRSWIDDSCEFCSTLVDRIVSGFPKGEEEVLFEELGYEDRLFVVGEPFALWVIEGSENVEKEIGFAKAGLPVVYTDNLKPYKKRKVRILNGAHTSFVPASYLSGNDIVLESMNDKLIYDFMHDTLYKEVIPAFSGNNGKGASASNQNESSQSGLSGEELERFAASVIERFENPYVKHALLSISLNSVSKWKARCMPSLLDYVAAFDTNPLHLTFSLAALMAFYSSQTLEDGALAGDRKGEKYLIKDDSEVVEFFRTYSLESTKVFVHEFLSKESFWGMDLTKVADTEILVTAYLDDIKTLGMREAIEKNFA